MTYQKGSTGSRGNREMGHAAAIMLLLLGTCAGNAFAAEAQEMKKANVRPSVDVSDPGTPSAARPMTDFEKLDLYHRRYTAAANNIAQLYKQLNQRIQEVSLAAKTFETKDSSHNQRLLETKLRQLENVRTSYGVQYSQLHAQMQNEYRNYAALSSELKNRYDTSADSGSRQGRKDVTDSRRAGDGRGKKAKSEKTAKTNDANSRHLKGREPGPEDLHAEEMPPDPRVLDMSTRELRARRDGLDAPASPAPQTLPLRP